jgi:hypothetical protein
MRHLRFSVVILTCALGTFIDGYSQYPKTHPQPPGGVDGSVATSRGAPVSGAQVLWQASDGGKPHVLHSDGHGHFQIAKLRPGLYELRASKSGLQSEWTHNVLVRPGAPTMVTLRLENPK